MKFIYTRSKASLQFWNGDYVNACHQPLSCCKINSFICIQYMYTSLQMGIKLTTFVILIA